MFYFGFWFLIETLILVVDGDSDRSDEKHRPLFSKSQLRTLESPFHGHEHLQKQLNAWKFNIRLDPNQHFQKLHRSKSPRFSPSQPLMEFHRHVHPFLALPPKWPTKEVIHVKTPQETPFLSHLRLHRNMKTDPYPHPSHDISTSASHLNPKLSLPWPKNDPLIPDDSTLFRQYPPKRVTRTLRYWDHNNEDFREPSFPFKHVPDYPTPQVTSARHTLRGFPGLTKARNEVDLLSNRWPTRITHGPLTDQFPYPSLPRQPEVFSVQNEGRVTGIHGPQSNQNLGKKRVPNVEHRLVGSFPLGTPLPSSSSSSAITQSINLRGAPVSSHSFEYEIVDPTIGSAFGHRETTKEEFTSGFYFIDLPGESFQRVSYVKPRPAAII